MEKFQTSRSYWFAVRLLAVAAMICASAVQVFPQAVRKIAFTHGGGALASRIAVINEDGSNMVILTGGGQDRDPAWSPDGSQIVYSGHRINGINIIRMNVDGTGQVPLTDTFGSVINQEPAWSPDGKKIAFTSNRAEAHRNEIWVMNADGKNPVRLTVNVQLGSDSGGPIYGHDFGPAWSPDGNKIVFWSDRNSLANPEIYVMNADGSNQIRLTNNPAEDRDPVWSRDGQRITFSRKSAGIWEINADGTNEHRIADGFSPDWSPDGQRLAVTDFDASAFAVFLVNPDGTNRVRLTNTGFLDSSSAAWQTLGGPAPPPPPPPPVFTVTGRVVDTSIAIAGPGVPGITISLTGSSSATTTSDGNGNFFFDNLPENGTFSLVASNPNWSFSPTNRTFDTIDPLNDFIGRNINVQFDAAPIFLQFTSASYSGTEGSSVFITVERVGFITGTSTIMYSTSDGTAVGGADYVPVSGTLTFNPFDGIKTFQVPLIYDKMGEPPETITLTLTNPTGGLVRGRQTAVLNVSDPFPQLFTQPNSSLAIALNAETWVRDPFTRTTTSFLGENTPTRVALFAGFVDLAPGEDMTAVTAFGFDSGGVLHELPVEFVGKVPDFDDLTQINIRLPADTPTGDIFVGIRLHGMGSNTARIRIQQ